MVREKRIPNLSRTWDRGLGQRLGLVRLEERCFAGDRATLAQSIIVGAVRACMQLFDCSVIVSTVVVSKHLITNLRYLNS